MKWSYLSWGQLKVKKPILKGYKARKMGHNDRGEKYTTWDWI